MLKQGLSIDTTFYPPQFSLDSTFKAALKKFKYQASHALTKAFNTTPLSGGSNLVTQSL
jgi:hypothetical protein